MKAENNAPRHSRDNDSIREIQATEELVQASLLKQLKKDFPSAKDWPKFSGEGEYNHHIFIDWVDQVMDDLMIPDKLITSKLGIVFTDTARDWYQEKRKEIGSCTWKEWKIHIEERFGNDVWKNKMEENFLKDKFNPAIHTDCLTWALKQKKRIQAFAPESTAKRICDKILFRIDAEISTQVRSLMGDHNSWDKFSAAFQEVCKNPNLAKKYKMNTTFRNKQYMSARLNNREKTNSSTQVQQNNSVKRMSKPCPKCGITDNNHEWKSCQGKRKGVNNIDIEEEEDN
ncbi:hypothetical protein CROQUDRAFT_55231, partial [Cronartium quercuum f. sp. fusiforme G11]